MRKFCRTSCIYLYFSNLYYHFRCRIYFSCDGQREDHSWFSLDSVLGDVCYLCIKKSYQNVRLVGYAVYLQFVSNSIPFLNLQRHTFIAGFAAVMSEIVILVVNQSLFKDKSSDILKLT